MKKYIALLLFIATVLFLAACNTEKEGVPYDIVEYAVSQEFDGKTIIMNINHDVDTKTHLDHITIDVAVPFEYCYEKYLGIGSYRYNKANDIWDLYGDITWQFVTETYRPDLFIDTYEGTDNSSGAKYDITITDINFDKKEICGKFYIQDSHLLLSGQEKLIELDISGTFPLEMTEHGFLVTINQGDYMFILNFSGYYGLTYVGSSYAKKSSIANP